MPPITSLDVAKMIPDGKGGLYMALGSHLCHLVVHQTENKKISSPSLMFTSEKDAPLSSAMALSPAGDTIAIVDMAKHVTIIHVEKKTTLLRGILEKGAMCAVFSSRDTVLIGDKFGDIVQFVLGEDVHNETSLSGDPVKGAIIAGCVSMVTDLAVDEQRDTIVMADRDEKVRLIRRAQPWIIDDFCLEHTEYVMGIGLLDPAAPSWMVSLGGDARLILWDLRDCTRSKQVIHVEGNKGADEFDPYSFCRGQASVSFFTRGKKGDSTIYTFDVEVDEGIPRISDLPRLVAVNAPVTALAYCDGDVLVVATEGARLLMVDKGQSEVKELTNLREFVVSLSSVNHAYPTFTPLTMASTLRKRRYQFESAAKRRASLPQERDDDGDNEP